jgi:hypothetical protein
LVGAIGTARISFVSLWGIQELKPILKDFRLPWLKSMLILFLSVTAAFAKI